MIPLVIGEFTMDGSVAVARREVDGTLRRAEAGQDMFLKRLTDDCDVLVSTYPELTLQMINARLQAFAGDDARWDPAHRIDLSSMATGYLAARKKFNGSEALPEVFGPPNDVDAVSRAIGLDPQPFEIYEVVNKRLSWAIVLYERISR